MREAKWNKMEFSPFIEGGTLLCENTILGFEKRFQKISQKLRPGYNLDHHIFRIST